MGHKSVKNKKSETRVQNHWSNERQQKSFQGK